MGLGPTATDLKSESSIFGFFADARVKRLVAFLHHVGQRLVVDDPSRSKESAREGIHRTNVRNKPVVDVGGFTAHFAVEVEATRAQTALLQHVL